MRFIFRNEVATMTMFPVSIRSARRGLVALSVLVSGIVLAPGVTVSAALPELELQLIVAGLDYPVGIVHAADRSGRLFIAERAGRVRIIKEGQLLANPFLDIAAQVSSGGEQGLLGIAFRPDYKSNGFFYVSYTDLGGDSVISRFEVSAANPDLANHGSETVVLTQTQPATNHNGGDLAFGPDGYLYVGLGDGGGAGDPWDNSQNLGTRLGKLLRVDVNGGSLYAVPPDNPYIGVAGALPEIWALGLRNPWRFSFDRLTGDLIIGDVGQGSWEEIDFQPAASPGGENYGWRCYEGSAPYNTAGCGPVGDYVQPVLEYSHSLGCSVTGGYRYRGVAFPGLGGTYLFADYCSGMIWGATPLPGCAVDVELSSPLSPSSLGEDEQGELYIAHLAAQPDGAVYRIIEISGLLFADGFAAADLTRWTASAP
jgi:glucose/arabinose dehydrogenase